MCLPEAWWFVWKLKKKKNRHFISDFYGPNTFVEHNENKLLEKVIHVLRCHGNVNVL